MPSKAARRSQAATTGAAQKKRPRKGKAAGSVTPAQTNQPYEQDTKRRIGQFSGAGDPPLIKK